MGDRDIYYEEIFNRRNIYEEPLWQIGPDGKYYCTPEGLRRAKEKWLIIRAKEEWLKSITYNNPQQDKIIKKEKPPSLINLNEDQPPEILSPDLLDELTKIPADQLRDLADFLASLPPPPTSSSEQK
jgi:hypothetical protein